MDSWKVKEITTSLQKGNPSPPYLKRKILQNLLHKNPLHNRGPTIQFLVLFFIRSHSPKYNLKKKKYIKNIFLQSHNYTITTRAMYFSILRKEKKNLILSLTFVNFFQYSEENFSKQKKLGYWKIFETPTRYFLNVFFLFFLLRILYF